MTEGRVGIVTGGARGIGLAVAKALASDGLAVVIGDVDEEGARKAADAIRALGGRALGIRTDVTVAADAKALVDLRRERIRSPGLCGEQRRDHLGPEAHGRHR